MRTKLDTPNLRPGDRKAPPLASAPPPRRPSRALWSVAVEVLERGATWQWAGFAADSTEAAELARRDFYGPLFDDEAIRRLHPVRVRSVIQLGV